MGRSFLVPSFPEFHPGFRGNHHPAIGAVAAPVKAHGIGPALGIGLAAGTIAADAEGYGPAYAYYGPAYGPGYAL